MPCTFRQLPKRFQQALACGTLTATMVWAWPAAQAAERTIEKQVVINATLDEAWAAWTTREGIVSFFAPDARIEPRVGGAFQIYFDPGAPAGSKGADDMRLMALQPKKMLSFDWNAPPSLPEARAQRTFVVLRFKPLAERSTEVSLHHTGWGEGGEWDRAYAYFDRAWGGVLGSLKKRFETGPVDWTNWLQQLQAMRQARAASAAAAAPVPSAPAAAASAAPASAR
jgi:uncharacterized protein YndB with AHSA1/START domain